MPHFLAHVHFKVLPSHFRAFLKHVIYAQFVYFTNFLIGRHCKNSDHNSITISILYIFLTNNNVLSAFSTIAHCHTHTQSLTVSFAFTILLICLLPLFSQFGMYQLPKKKKRKRAKTEERNARM